MYSFTKITIILFLIFFASQKIFAVTHYVSKTGGHIPPFTSWANAATNIQPAVNAASANDIVLVGNVIYYRNNEREISQKISLKSLNGAENTIVDGNNYSRCFKLSGSVNIEIDGFTIKKGKAKEGGGIYCAYGDVVKNCIITRNSATENGGGVFCSYNDVVQNCTISFNSAYDNGGGVYLKSGGTVQSSTIRNNRAHDYGGGVYFYNGGIVQSCAIINNYTDYNNSRGGGIYCLDSGLIKNCTISDNSTDSVGGGISCNSSADSKIYNSIIYYNTCGHDSDYDNIYLGTIRYSCSYPQKYGAGNIFFAPGFIDRENDNYRLNEFSPCVDAGTNAFAGGDWDIDGNPRIIDGRVDMGAYEFVPEPTFIFSFFIIFYSIFLASRINIFII